MNDAMSYSKDGAYPQQERGGFGRPSYRPAPAHPGLDPEMRRMGLIAGGAAGVLLLGVAAASLIGGRHHARPIPIIAAEDGPVRVKPADRGGMQVVDADEAAAPGAAEQLAPPPERPDLAILRARPHPKPVEKPTPIAAAPPVAQASIRVPAGSVLHSPALAPPVPPVSAGLTTATEVQLAAFHTEAEADAAWTTINARHPGLLAGREKHVVRAELDGRPVWRLRTGHFVNLAAATTFCTKLRADHEDCTIAAF